MAKYKALEKVYIIISKNENKKSVVVIINTRTGIGMDTRTIRGCVVKILMKQCGYYGKKSQEYELLIHTLAKKVSKNNMDVYNEIVYEKLGHLIACKNTDTSSNMTYDEDSILNDIRSGVVSWRSSPYKNIRREREEFIIKQRTKPDAVEGMYECTKECGSTSFFIWKQQTRSGDEAETVYAQCQKCGKRNRQ